MDLLNKHAVPMMPAVCATIAEDPFRGDVPGTSEDVFVVDQEAAEALVRQTFRDFEIARKAQLEEDAKFNASINNDARASCSDPPAQVEMCNQPDPAAAPHQEMQEAMGLVAQATQQIESERILKLEAEQQAKLAAQNAAQHVSFMQNAINVEVERIKRGAEASRASASQHVHAVVTTAERRLSDASAANHFLQGQVEQLQKEKAEAERKYEQKSTRSGAASARSTYDMSTPEATPRVPSFKLVPDFFQNLWSQPAVPTIVSAPTMTMTAPLRVEQLPLPMPPVRVTGGSQASSVSGAKAAPAEPAFWPQAVQPARPQATQVGTGVMPMYKPSHENGHFP